MPDVFERDLLVNDPIDSYYYMHVDLSGVAMDSSGMTTEHLAADNHEPGFDVRLLDEGVFEKS